MAERLFLWGNELLQHLMFRSWGEEVYLEPADGSSLEGIEEVWDAYIHGFGAPLVLPEGFGPEEERTWRKQLIAHPWARVRMARTAAGRAVGYSATIAVYGDSVGLLMSHPVFAPLLQEYFGPDGLDALPAEPRASPYHYLLQAATVPELSEPAQAPLLRDVIGQLAAGGVYLTTVTSSDRKRLCEAMGFETVPSAHALLGPELEAQGYVLDLREVGVEGWLEGLIQGRPPALVVSMEDVARAVQAALVAWPDDSALAASLLADLAEAEGAEHARAEAVRRLLRDALDAARQSMPDRKQALKAVELAYLDRSASHERVAERLAVSRSTFYRLLKRGVQALARAVARR